MSVRPVLERNATRCASISEAHKTLAGISLICVGLSDAFPIYFVYQVLSVVIRRSCSKGGKMGLV